MEPLKKELETFERLKEELLKDEGKYAVIHEDELHGVFTSYDDALQAAYREYGLKPFLVKRILRFEQINFFSRDLTPCPI